MIQFKKIRKSFQVDFWKKSNLVLDDISFDINEGKITGFLGSNGAGKTTLIKILMKLIKCDSGEIIFKDLFSSGKNYLEHIGYLPERPYFYPHLTGYEFLSYLGGLSEVKESLLKERIHYWGSKVNILFALDRQIKTYSKGMLQRLGVLTTLIHDPKLIVLDEPLSGLDPIGRKEIKNVILELNSIGKTIFFSSHIIPDVEEICHKIVFLNDKKIFYQGDLKSLFSKTLGAKRNIKFSISHKNWEQLGLSEFIVNQNDQQFEVAVDEDISNKVIKNIIDHGGTILKINSEQMGLESIFLSLKEESVL